MTQEGLVTNHDGALEVTNAGRRALGLPSREGVKLKIPEKTEEFQQLLLQVLACQNGIESYRFEDCLQDARRLGARFGFDVLAQPKTWFHNKLLVVADELSRANPPRVKLDGPKGEETISLLY